ncbi:lysine N6-hydroxylase [Catenulispora sp. MAP12-49]|uniref:lysine N(6)-hydroxylase/L-ornithine N(5)-oxygenase family protein n=1 Tax=Catenulispora sp. MAP12-49 TaxID=3156302 RepID=UPI003510F73D
MQHYDVVGVGIGPFNLSLAALAEPLRENHSLQPLFLEERPVFAWHRGMMLDGATLQVPFLADLVSLTDPTSRFSVLNWLRETDRLYSFYFAENLFLQRREYEAYCQWVAAQLPFCRFGTAVTRIRRAEVGFEIEYTAPSGPTMATAANIVLGIGTEPVTPFDLPGATLHSADYLLHRERLRTLDDVTVVGSGQSGAEIVLDLVRGGAPGQRVRWLTRSAAFEPMEYSQLGLEHFTPDYTRFFHGLREDVRADLLRTQGRLHKAISFETIADLYAELHMRSFDSLYGGTLGLAGDTGATLLPGVSVTGATYQVQQSQQARQSQGPGSVELTCLHDRQKREFSVLTDAVVLATGYRDRIPSFLDPGLAALLGPADLEHRAAPGVFVQNAEQRTHGVGAPDLGLGAHRAAVILNALTGRTVYDLPRRAAHTAFDPEAAAERDPGIRIEVP